MLLLKYKNVLVAGMIPIYSAYNNLLFLHNLNVIYCFEQYKHYLSFLNTTVVRTILTHHTFFRQYKQHNFLQTV